MKKLIFRDKKANFFIEARSTDDVECALIQPILGLFSDDCDATRSLDAPRHFFQIDKVETNFTKQPGPKKVM